MDWRGNLEKMIAHTLLARLHTLVYGESTCSGY